MNALTLDGFPINSTIGKASVETFTKQDIDDAQNAGIEIGMQMAEHNTKITVLAANKDRDLFANALLGAVAALDNGVLYSDVRKLIDAALERAEEISNGKA